MFNFGIKEIVEYDLEAGARLYWCSMEYHPCVPELIAGIRWLKNGEVYPFSNSRYLPASVYDSIGRHDDDEEDEPALGHYDEF